jgi:hypothetical protein
VTAAPQPSRSGGLGTAEKLVIALIVVALIGGGYLVYLNMQVNRIVDDVGNTIASLTPTRRPVTPAPPPANSELTASLGEAVELIDTTSGADLGTVTVIKNGKPRTILEIPPTSGTRYIAALVNYTAEGTWYYNRFDWAAHDSAQRQYEPHYLAPHPTLDSGTLSAGRQVEAWVCFEVPSTVRDVWVDFRSGDGTVIFTVKID